MTLFELIRKFENLALAAPNVRTAADGNVYDAMNDNPKLKYGVFFVSQDTHQEFEQMDRYGLTLFYIDRLDDTLEDNRLQIQSIGKEILSTVIRDFCEEYDVDLPTMNYIPFTEKFKDLTAGIYVQITIEVYKDDCYDDFSEVKSVYQTKVVDIYHNGEYSIQPDKDYTALKEVIVNVNVECSGCTPEQLEEAYQSGRTDQKNLLSTTAFTENGSYSSENGWSGVTINVPTGSTINNQNKSISFSANTSTTITYDGGYTGLESVSIEVNVPQTGYTQEDLEEAYESGETHQKSLLTTTAFTENGEYTIENGWSGVTVDIDTDAYYNSGYTNGVNYQKSLITDLYVTENGTYVRQDGYSPVVVKIEQTGYTQEDLDDAYNRGYEDGFNAKSRLTVSPIEIFQSNNSGTTTIQLLSNTDWVVDSIPSWCSLSSLSGTGNATLTLTVNSNEGASRRNKVVFKTTDNYATGQTIINQEEVTGTISVVPSSNNLHYNAQTLTLTATSNVPWTILDYPDWAVPNVTSGTSGTTTIIVTLSENTGDERRGYINFNTNYGSAEASVCIRQGYNTKPTSSNYLTFNVTSDGNIIWKDIFSRAIQYSKNNGAWTNITPTSGGTAIPVVSGDVVKFRGDNARYGDGILDEQCATFNGTSCSFTLSGNIMSLINSTDYGTIKTLSSGDTFRRMFYGCTGLTDASNLELPATTLADRCYYDMFRNCTKLVNAPALPATNLANECYDSMFYNCAKLVNAPALPATVLSEGCYKWMFSWCTSLTKLPTLSGRTLAEYCYENMFTSSGIKTVSSNYLPVTKLKEGCYKDMFSCCLSLTSVPSNLLPATTLTPYCYYGMFFRCVKLEVAPDLPATTLTTGCYWKMFYNCEKMYSIKSLAVNNINTNDSTTDWVNGTGTKAFFVTKTFTKKTNANWPTGNNGIPSGWTIVNV